MPVLAVVGILAFALAKPIGQLVGETSMKKFAEGRLDGQLATMQAAIAVEMRKQLPQKIDYVTTLQSVTSLGPMLSYHYIVDLNPDAVEAPRLLEELRKKVVPNVCTQKDMRKVIDVGGKYQYVYMTRSGTSVGDFSIAKPECSALDN